MRLTCPACHAEMSLEAAIGREVDAAAVAGFLARNLVLGQPLLQYIALFRPPKRRLGVARMVALIEELMPDVQRCAITRKGREWAAPHEAWHAAFAQVLAARDKGTLTLPMTSHGYLYEVLAGQADKAEAVAEREHEKDLRSRPYVAGATPLASVLNQAAPQGMPAVIGPTTTQPPAPPAAPMPAEVRERLAQLRSGVAAAPTTGGDPA